MINANDVLFSRAIRRKGLAALTAMSALLAPTSMPAAFAADQAAAPIPVDCATIRYHVAEHGKAKSIAWAIKNGYSWAQIAEAKRCLRG
ncbi:hypothetical protein IP86_07695 [Rhodopseudomonas sp. AAP120]|uniref:hypothetical protein n=1 Tax=Rhodopseudomonas sp. AAP120 TaxID=1523430 RepID=UPI0006B93DE9|nr:hypothetical protein [Rhodopseudomonas sp. AAP120]KPG00005.1 hypothetical protein IP86_07695 [Rhodopseudomonas sp. AAP120]